MKKIISITAVLILLLTLAISGCSSSGQKDTPAPTASKIGSLQFKANGEDFIRQGFVSKDGWSITFDHVYVHLANITAYQANPPYDPDKGGEIQAATRVSLPGTRLVDLAQGDENAPPILVGEAKAAAGHYNAISWEMTRAGDGPARGYSLVLAGKAEKGGKSISFTIKDERQYKYTGGEFIGDERKGLVQEGGSADLEMTFHFDHIFGDAETPADDELNQGAPGFAPFAALAKDGKVEVDMAQLKEKLSPADYKKLTEMLLTLGHVGEGHCHSELLQ